MIFPRLITGTYYCFRTIKIAPKLKVESFNLPDKNGFNKIPNFVVTNEGSFLRLDTVIYRILNVFKEIMRLEDKACP